MRCMFLKHNIARNTKQFVLFIFPEMYAASANVNLINLWRATRILSQNLVQKIIQRTNASNAMITSKVT